jgi:transcriptional regulator with XRE-family HTH domain
MAILRLKEIMGQKGIGREELAEKVGVSVTTISNINTENNLPTIQRLLEIARVLDVDIRELFVPTMGGAITNVEVSEAKEHIAKGLAILNGKRR